MSERIFHEFGVFPSGDGSGEQFGESASSPMAGYALLAQAITLEPEVPWRLLARQVSCSAWGIDGPFMTRDVRTSPWSEFSLCAKRDAP